MRGKPHYLKFCEQAERMCRRARIPTKNSKYSNGVYTIWTLLILAGLRQYENKSYRRFMEWLEVTDQIQACLGLERLPHYTTLHKFTQRIPPVWIHLLLKESNSPVDEPVTVAIDSTGFRSDHASQHYIKRMTRLGVKRVCVKSHLKLTIGVETESQLVVSYKIRRGPASDYWDFPAVARRAASAVPLGTIVADRGYDSEANHELVREVLKADSIIPPRNKDVPIWRTHGKYRKQMKQGYDKDIYHQRSKDETVNSVVKRVMGESVRDRKVKTQNRAIGLRLFAYDCQRSARINS